jgi:hypothetical protein
MHITPDLPQRELASSPKCSLKDCPDSCKIDG